MKTHFGKASLICADFIASLAIRKKCVKLAQYSSVPAPAIVLISSLILRYTLNWPSVVSIAGCQIPTEVESE